MTTEARSSLNHGLDPKIWTVMVVGGTTYGQCILCDETIGKRRLLKHCKPHEKTQEHRNNVTAQQDREHHLRNLLQPPKHDTNAPSSSFSIPERDWAADRGSLALLSSMYRRHASPPPAHNPYSAEEQLFNLDQDASLPHDLPAPVAQGIADLSQTLINMARPPSPESDESSSDSESESDCSDDGGQAGIHDEIEQGVLSDSEDSVADSEPHDEGHSRKRQRMNQDAPTDNEWYPWPDRLSCTLDILMHLPRSVFSQRQLDLFLWLLTVNGVHEVPSVYQMKTLNEKLQRWTGIETLKKISPFGNVYYQNNFAQIFSQEMANPRVRPHLSHLPEDAGTHVSEARHGLRWAEEIPDDLAAPMVRLRGKDFYIFEPSVLWNHAKADYCVPIRWFTRGDEIFARCYTLQAVSGGWIVLPEIIEVHQDQFLMNFVDFCDAHKRDHVPDPRVILGVLNPHNPAVLSPWNHRTLGNPWRERAKGKRVLSLPIWLYCDDTSGNVSKKWNKHNSFLFTLAGLNRSESQKEYNVHFLCTSNIAGPLEMLDGVAEQIEKAQQEGIEAWDCVFGEDVIVIPWVLALLGDNPMQSEFAAHIGLRGKFFCRICKVKGKDSLDTPAFDGPGAPGSRPATPAVGDDDETNDDDGQPSKSGKKKKPLETLDQIRRRFADFIKAAHRAAFPQIGELRNKYESRHKLKQMFDSVVHGAAANTFEKETTATGLKDGFLVHYVDKIFKVAKKLRNDRRDEAIRSTIEHFPDDVTSPVWRIKELDPHRDTPVEVLHVVLLGFVKYMWRDVVSVQLKKKDAQLETLKHRLSSFDVSGLGISPLNGHTLVQYAGSLVGRDFRVIAQVAPFVLHGLIPDEPYQTWLSLSRLIPMIWQPVIEDIDQYCASLKKEIDAFLLQTAKWTGRWFNKPKFHILLHLPDHIRRFGPAILFATEAFESFNAVIRAKSVHSNRQAPSRDIALAFAQGNRIRHLLSEGMFKERDIDGQIRSDRRWIGPGPRKLINSTDNTVRDYLGIPSGAGDDWKKGTCIQSKKPPLPFQQTQTFRHFPQQQHSDAKYQDMKTAILLNGDPCKAGSHVIVRDSKRESGVGGYFVGRVEEIVRRVENISIGEVGKATPDWILVEVADHRTINSNYNMPALAYTQRRLMIDIRDIRGTVNAPHDCISNGCGLTGTQMIYQEREVTSHVLPRIEHALNPSQRILNIAQMRNSRYLSHFRIPPRVFTSLERDAIVQDCAEREYCSLQKHSKTPGPRPISRPATPRQQTPAVPPASTSAVAGPNSQPTTAISPLPNHRFLPPHPVPRSNAMVQDRQIIGLPANAQYTFNRPGFGPTRYYSSTSSGNQGYNANFHHSQ
ncbi:hypothetical protein VNI00_007623 [Paramarasmius palmivorus]|uniref:Transposase n=1 Tax=Paramarasmius palmivorus TaxID=297713 RepID=A0AAW0D227_9AGAR